MRGGEAHVPHMHTHVCGPVHWALTHPAAGRLPARSGCMGTTWEGGVFGDYLHIHNSSPQTALPGSRCGSRVHGCPRHKAGHGRAAGQGSPLQ
eukprot:gene11883-biopygen7251